MISVIAGILGSGGVTTAVIWFCKAYCGCGNDDVDHYCVKPCRRDKTGNHKNGRTIVIFILIDCFLLVVVSLETLCLMSAIHILGKY